MIRTLGRILAIGLVVLTAVVALLMAAAWATLPLENVALTLRGETFSLADLSGSSAVVFFLLSVAAIVIAVIVGLAAVVVGLVFAVLGVAFGLTVTAAVLVVVASPFALIIWLTWRAVRPRPAQVVVASP